MSRSATKAHTRFQYIFQHSLTIIDNQNFINNSTTLTIGPAEGAAIFVIGKQDGAPVLDLHLVLR